MSEDADRADLSAEAQPVLRSPKGEAGRAKADVPPTDRLTGLWRRLKEHRIAQWTVGYVAVAYGIQHGVTLTSEAFKWPDAVIRISMLLLALGLPVAMTLAWYHGERTARRISSGELAVVSVVLLGISFAFYLFVRPAERVSARYAAAQTVAENALTAKPAGVFLAVLPFLNLSSDKEQEFFSDGMTEEITSALAKVQGLRVVGRTSAFQFKGENKDLRSIGQALSATHLIEGSVRKDGNEVRITAQLIKADDGTHLWTESYDRELKGVFAIQEEIAQAIVTSLKVPLGLQQGQTLVRDRTNDLESYDQYLRAKALARSGGVGDLAQASKLLEQVVARDPGFAPGWALLAETYHAPPVPGSREELRRIVDLNMDKEEMAAREAIRLDSKYALGYAALARNQGFRGNRIAAEDLLKQALALDGDDPDVLSDYCSTLTITGRLKEATNLCMKLRTLDPLIPEYGLEAAFIMQLNGQDRAAISILEASPSSTLRNIRLARSYAAERRFAEAADTLLLINDPVAQDTKEVEGAARLLRTAPAKVSAPKALPDLNPGLSFVYAYVGALDHALDAFERRRQISQAGLNSNMWLPVFSPLRKTERFKAYVRQGGLVDFWRARGWPDLCHPVGADDFACN